MSEQPRRSLRMRSAIMLALVACATVAVALGGFALVGAESARQTAVHRSLLDASARRVAASFDQFLALHLAAIEMVATDFDAANCTDAACRARRIAQLRQRFPAFESVVERESVASATTWLSSTQRIGEDGIALFVSLTVPRTRAGGGTAGIEGVLRVPVERLFSTSRDERADAGRELLLLDAAGDVLYGSTNRYAASQRAPQALLDAVRAGADEARVDDEAMLLRAETIDAAGWRVVATISRTRIAPARTALAGAAGLALLAGLALTAAASVWISRALSRALEGLAHAMRELDLDRLDEASMSDALRRSAFRETQDIAAAVRAMCARLVAVRDVQRRAHDDLDRANRELAALVRQREAQVETRTEELRRALETANDAIRARDALLANTSHEIRTPLYGIIGGVELVRPSLTDAHDLNNLDAIMQSAESLMQLINDLLDFSRINAGALELDTRPFSLADVARDVAATVQPLATKRGIAVRLSNRLAASTRRGDALRVRQVLLNLVGNAVKFIERGEVTVDLDGDDERVRFVVADTGVGIAPDDLDRIFKPFEQADASMRRRFQGSGLGLAIVDKLVSAMGGSVGVASQLGKGSTFTVDLPLPPGVAERSDDDDAPAPLGNAAGMRVLVVDDVPINRMLLGTQIERLGAQVLRAADGFEALTVLARERVDLVLLDVQMPGIDGLETAERMRALPNGSNVRIVAVTANAQPGERENCLAASMDDYVTKPLRMADLRRLLAAAAAYANPAPPDEAPVDR